MLVHSENYFNIQAQAKAKKATLVVVTKTKPIAQLQALYELGARDFGENYVQELVEKYEALPKDIRWHFIGHLQSNKVKYIAPFVHLIHGIDSLSLLKEIQKQAHKNNRIIQCLLQVYIAQEETKFGLNEQELDEVLAYVQQHPLTYVSIQGLMGMASFTSDKELIKQEFATLYKLYAKHAATHSFTTLSMGMSSDYEIALAEGSNLIRVGSLIMGGR